MTIKGYQKNGFKIFVFTRFEILATQFYVLKSKTCVEIYDLHKI